MYIRKATMRDLPEILNIYDTARAYMAAEGNAGQWAGGYPQESILINDMQEGQLYVCYSEVGLHGVFAFIIGEDPTYAHIDGQWTNDLPYGTIHRVASNGTAKGIMTACIAYCKQQIDNLRIDTHAKNQTMQHLILKNEFQYCGIIYVEDGTPRNAYQWTK